MAKSKRPGIPLYLVPITIMGLCGVLFARQLPNPILQSIVIVLSVGTSLFAMGIAVTRIHATGYQRGILIAGVAMLLAGSLVMVSGLPERLVNLEEVPEVVSRVSRGLGLGSLILGLFAILVILARREEQTEEMAQQFRYLAQHMSEGFILTAPDGTIILVNDAVAKLTGLKVSELIGQNDRILARQLDLEPMLPHIEDRRRGIASEYNITMRVRGEERHLWVNGTPLFDSRGRYSGALATIRDVTEQHRLAEHLEKYTHGLQKLVEDRTQKLDRSQQRLRDLLVNMNEGFMTIDATYHIRFANSRICEMLQLKPEQLVERDLFTFVEPGGRGRLLEVLENAQLRRGRRQHQELLLCRPGGDNLPVVASIAPIEESPGEDERYSLVLTDVGELKEMQRQLEVRAQELEEANAELRMLDRAKDGFLSNVSHELRTPLSTVRGYVEMFGSGNFGPVDSSQSGALKVIIRNVERLGNLIDEIIEFTRMEIRGLQLNYSLFSVNHLLQESAASIKPQLLARDLVMEIEQVNGNVRMWGDQKRVGQVIVILLSNAVKFCNKGDRIALHADTRDDRTVTLTVKDTGIGIDKESQKRIFDKFYQVDSSLARRYEGAGIGLSIAKSIMEAHGGSIELDSDTGAGSTFTLVFPDALFDEPEEPCDGDETIIAEVLLIAGDVELASAVRRALSARHCHVTVAVSGFEGVRMFQEQEPDIVLVNEEPSSLNALQTAERLRETGLNGETRVLILSDRNLATREPAEFTQSHVEVLFKPFSTQDLMERLALSPGRGKGEHQEDSSRLSIAQNRVAVLSVSPDGELQDWINTACRVHEFPCVCVRNCAEATALLKNFTPEVVLVDLDVSESEAICIHEILRPEMARVGAPLYVMTGLTAKNEQLVECSGVFTKPFSTKELVETLSAAVSRSV